MYNFLSEIIKIMNDRGIIPIIYGSVGVSKYLGEFKDFGDLDILIPPEYVTEKWSDFKKYIGENGFTLTDEKEHEFISTTGKKIAFASSGILIRDNIIKDERELVSFYDNVNSLTLTPQQFLLAYEFSQKDGYRIEKRHKQDQATIALLKEYIQDEK